MKSAEQLALVTALARIRHLSHKAGHVRHRERLEKGEASESDINQIANEALAPYESAGHWMDAALTEARERTPTREEMELFRAYQLLWADLRRLETENEKLKTEVEVLKGVSDAT